MDHLKMHSEVLLLSIVCILIILIIWCVVALFNYVDMNNDNTLLHYLDK